MKVYTEKLECRGVAEKKGKNNVYYVGNFEDYSGESHKQYMGFEKPDLKRGDVVIMQLEFGESYGKPSLNYLAHELV